MTYFTDLTTWFAQSTQYQHVLGGDLNVVAHTGEDKTNTQRTQLKTKTKHSMTDYQPTQLTHFMESTRLKDAWRLCYPIEREYTHYSFAHKSFSRIDYLLTTDDLINKISPTKIHEIAISDHAPISMTLHAHPKTDKHTWRYP